MPFMYKIIHNGQLCDATINSVDHENDRIKLTLHRESFPAGSISVERTLSTLQWVTPCEAPMETWTNEKRAYRDPLYFVESMHIPRSVCEQVVELFQNSDYGVSTSYDGYWTVKPNGRKYATVVCRYRSGIDPALFQVATIATTLSAMSEMLQFQKELIEANLLVQQANEIIMKGVGSNESGASAEHH